MSKKVIGIDIDNTFGDFTGALRNFVAASNGFNEEQALALMPEPQEYDVNDWQLEGTGFNSFKEVFRAAESEGLYLSMKPLPHAQVACQQLAISGYEMVAVTSRNAKHRTETEMWLSNQAPHIQELIHTDDKWELHTEHGGFVDVFIDDAPKQLYQMSENNVPLIVFNQLYNVSFEITGSIVGRVSNWRQVPFAVDTAFAA